MEKMHEVRFVGWCNLSNTNKGAGQLNEEDRGKGVLFLKRILAHVADSVLTDYLHLQIIPRQSDELLPDRLS